MRARFKGDPERNNSGPEAITAFGLEFSKGAWVGIDSLDPVSLRKIKGNSHFEVDEGKAPKPVAAVTVETAPVAVEDVPANWREAHHKTRMKYARMIGANPASLVEADAALEAHFAVTPTPAASQPSIVDPPAKADDDWGDLDP